MQQDAEQKINALIAEIEQFKLEGEFEEAIETAVSLVKLSSEQRPTGQKVVALRILIELYEESGDYSAAISCYYQLRDIQRALLGAHHAEVAILSHDLAFMYDINGDTEMARVLYHEALELQRQALGSVHPDLACTLNNLATLYNHAGEYRAAILLHEEALAIKRAVYGDQHAETAQSLSNLAVALTGGGEYVRAETLYKEAIEIDERAVGEHAHPEYYAVDVNNLASLYLTQGRYEEAIQFFNLALRLRREGLGHRHLDVAQSLANLQAVYEEMGRYAEAIQVGEEALEIRREALSEENTLVAQSLNNLAGLCESVGDYSKASKYYTRALLIYLQQYGPVHPDYAKNLQNLAWLRQRLGDYGEAERLYDQALDALRFDPGPDHPDFATGLNNLGTLHHATGRYGSAETLLRHALEIRKVALGERHPDIGTTLTNLANVCRSEEKYGEALQLYKDAAVIDRDALGEGHPRYAADQNNLGLLYCDMGNYSEAEPLLREAVAVWRTTSGDHQLDIAATLDNLAGVLAATGREVEAANLLEEAGTIEEKMLNQVFNAGSEWQRLSFLQSLQSTMFSLISLTMRHDATIGGVLDAGRRKCLSLVLRRKGLAAEAFASQRDAVLGGRYPELQPQLRELFELRRMIARQTISGRGERNPDVYHSQLAQWAVERDILESELAGHIPEMNLRKQLDLVDIDTLAAHLDNGVALVEIVLYVPRDFEAVPAKGELRWSAPRYLAFVLHTTSDYSLEAVDLGEAHALDSLIDSFRLAIAIPETQGVRAVRKDRVNSRQPGASDYLGEGTKLRQALIDPLLRAIGECKSLLIAPDGELWRVPVEVLSLPGGGNLIDEFQISYLGSGRDLLMQGVREARPPSASMVAADPDFDFRSANRSPLVNALTTGEARLSSIGPRHFAPLPGTRVEGEEVASMLGVELFSGSAASKSMLEACRSPEILHLATHSFFLPRPEYSPVLDVESKARRGDHLLLELVNPLLRSGMALAGANTWLEVGTPRFDAEDGLVTAEEITGIDLLDTRLVVLSGCDTGLGHLHTGEGVFGLGRAFMLAGARTVIMSLWRVPDQQTAELMHHFYVNLLKGGAEGQGVRPAVALRLAQRAIKEKYSHPLYWGGFICQGDPGPLRVQPTKRLG